MTRARWITLAVVSAGTAMLLLATTVALRFAWVGVEAGPTERYTMGPVLWGFRTIGQLQKETAGRLGPP